MTNLTIPNADALWAYKPHAQVRKRTMFSMSLLASPAAASGLAPLDWCYGFDALGDHFSQNVAPTPVQDPHWVGRNEALRASLGLPEGWWQAPQVLTALAGNDRLPGSVTRASVYSGHQFGVWAGQLGDGRALSLGTLATPMGPQELQLKGAGLTPYSRMGDGRAVLRSSIREYLCSEAMWGLGIPTTRALCVVGSPTPVRRETWETAAIVTRVSPSFVRFGHFEHFAQADDREPLRQLLNHVLQHHFPALCELPTHEQPVAFLRAVTERTAELMAQWQAVGFCHGVMNTDNMSVMGLTLDYGPFQFLDAFDVHHICNHSDHQGRYAYGRQPQIAYWNLFCLGQALMPLIEDSDTALAALETYKTVFPAALDARLNAKLGLVQVHEGDRPLQQELQELLHTQRIDWTVFWRRFSQAMAEPANVVHAFEPVRDLFLDRAAWDAWLSRYQQRIDGLPRPVLAERMLRTNPKFILRNHLGELAIRQAQAGQFEMVADLLTVLQSPFDEHPAFEDWAALAPEWASSIEISCSS